MTSDVDRLLGALDDPAKRVRRAAAEALGGLASSDAGVRERLVAELAGGAVSRRWTVAYALFVAGDRSERLWPVFLDALGSDDGDLRWATARLVVDLEIPDLERRLAEAAASGPREQRKMGLYCLRERGTRHPDTEEVARRALADPEPGVRLAALATLVALSVNAAGAARAIVPLLDDTDAGVRRATAASLGKLGVADRVVRDALAAAARAPDAALARAARGALERLDP